MPIGPLFFDHVVSKTHTSQDNFTKQNYLMESCYPTLKTNVKFASKVTNYWMAQFSKIEAPKSIILAICLQGIITQE